MMNHRRFIRYLLIICLFFILIFIIGRHVTLCPPLPPLLVPSPKDLILRSVYFDSRPRNGYSNASVFLLEVKKVILQNNLILGCKVGKYFSTNFKIRNLGESIPIHDLHPQLTHDFVLLDCYNVPVETSSTSVSHFSNAFLIYRTEGNQSKLITVQSEHPFMIPAHHQPPSNSGYKFSVAVCVAVLFGQPPSFTEWLRYQKAIGVDHIHIIAEDSFTKGCASNDPYFNQLRNDNYISMDVWEKKLYSSEVWYHSQSLAYEDCIYRMRGTYDYIFMLDTDDFFIPRVPGQKGLHYYINKWCPRSGSCEFDWIDYYPDCGLKGDPGEDGNITSLLVSNARHLSHVPKSLHSPESVLDVGIHVPNKFVDDKWNVGYVSQSMAYVAHIRTGKMPPSYLC